MYYRDIGYLEEIHFFNNVYVRLINNQRIPKKFDCIIAPFSEYGVKTPLFALYLADKLKTPVHFFKIDPDNNIKFDYELKAKRIILCSYLYEEENFRKYSAQLKVILGNPFIIGSCAISIDKNNSSELGFYTFFGEYIARQEYFAINTTVENIKGSYNSLETQRVDFKTLYDMNTQRQLDEIVKCLLTNGVLLRFNYNELAIMIQKSEETSDFYVNKYVNKKISVYLFNNDGFQYFLEDFTYFFAKHDKVIVSEKLFKYMLSTPTPIFIFQDGVVYLGSSLKLVYVGQNYDNEQLIEVTFKDFEIIYNGESAESIGNCRELLQKVKEEVFR